MKVTIKRILILLIFISSCKEQLEATNASDEANSIRRAIDKEKKILAEKYIDVSEGDFRAKYTSYIYARDMKEGNGEARDGYEANIKYSLRKPDGEIISSSQFHTLQVGHESNINFFNEIIKDRLVVGEKWFILIDPDRLYGKALTRATHPDTWYELEIELLSYRKRIKIKEGLKKSPSLRYIYSKIGNPNIIDYNREEDRLIKIGDIENIKVDEKNNFLELSYFNPSKTHEYLYMVEEGIYLQIIKRYPAVQGFYVHVEAFLYKEDRGDFVGYYISDSPIDLDLFLTDEEKLSHYPCVGPMDWELNPIDKEITIFYHSETPGLGMEEFSDTTYKMYSDIESEIKSRRVFFKWDEEQKLFTKSRSENILENLLDLSYSASSHLKEDTVVYSVNNLSSRGLPWVEGEKGAGIGSEIIISSQDSMKKLFIYNGYQKQKHNLIDYNLYESNNRVKKLKLKSNNKEIEYEVSDSIALQSFNIPWNNVKELKIEILDIYEGTRWNDTCIDFIGVGE